MRKGYCYERNGRKFMDMGSNRRFKLVHGCVMGSGPIAGRHIGHCWIEETKYIKVPKDWKVSNKTFKMVTVHDYSRRYKRGHHLPMELYYHYGRIEERYVKRYNLERFNINALKYENWGPWPGDPVCRGRVRSLRR